ncbi:hypothetical protein MHU86_15297 [Fragilaria crotonensis]|nr:hypothetical protein MHU86_15297 [Fragilaria crotonensis]
MFVKGEVRIERRLLHTEAHGVKWMQSGELDLMMAILLCDGRYQDLCFVMPCCYCDSIAIAFAKFVEYQRALKMVKLGKEQDLDPVKLASHPGPIQSFCDSTCKRLLQVEKPPGAACDSPKPRDLRSSDDCLSMQRK